MKKYLIDVLDFAAVEAAHIRPEKPEKRDGIPVVSVPILRTERTWTQIGQSRKAAKIVAEGNGKVIVRLRKASQPKDDVTYPNTLMGWWTMTNLNAVPHFYGRDENGQPLEGFRPAEVTEALINQHKALHWRGGGDPQKALEEWDAYGELGREMGRQKWLEAQLAEAANGSLD